MLPTVELEWPRAPDPAAPDIVDRASKESCEGGSPERRSDEVSERSSRAWVRAVVASVGIGWASPSVAHADEEACVVRVTPVDAPGDWQSAKVDAERRLATWPAHHDCRLVELLVHPDGSGTLSFLTSDGRGAARALEHASEVVPTLEALLVTLPAPIAKPPESPTPTPAPVPTFSTAPPAPLPSPGTLPSSVPPVPTAPTVWPTEHAKSLEVHVVVDVDLGARFSVGDTQYASPHIAVRPAVTLGAWELDLRLDLVPLYAPLDRPALEGFAMSSVTTAIGFGRRETFPSVALGYGLWVGVSAVGEEAAASATQATARELEAIQPHLGAVGRIVLPRTGWARALFDLNLDLALARLRPGAVRERALMDLPRFAVITALGMELGIL